MRKLILLLLLSSTCFAQALAPIYKEFENANYEEVINKLNTKEYTNRKDQTYLGVRSYLLGVSHARLQEFSEAIVFFEASLKYNNKSREIFYELGQANYAINSLEKAIQNFKQSRKLKYKIEQSTYYLGYIYQLKEDHKNAKVYYSLLLKDKGTSVEMRQIAYFQIAQMNLELARSTPRVAEIAGKYIIPDLYKAIDINPNSSTADDIEKRIKEIKAEFYLEEDKLVNGAPLPSERLEISIDQRITYDNNVTLSDDLPSSTGTNKDSFLSATRFNISKAKNFKRRYTVTPSLEISKTKYSDRADSEIYANDRYNITPEIEVDFAYKYKKKAARLMTKYTYDYQGKDVEAKKDTQFNFRSNQFSLGTELPIFETGNTTFTLKLQNYSYYAEDLNRSSKIISIDQILRKTYGLFILLYQADITQFDTQDSLNTTTHLFRLDYIRPGVFPNTTLNIGASLSLISYEDEAESESHGLEKSLNFNTKLTRILNRHFSFGVEYSYLNNISDIEESNYSAHSTSFEFSYFY